VTVSCDMADCRWCIGINVNDSSSFLFRVNKLSGYILQLYSHPYMDSGALWISRDIFA
jgi:hypothetical protein